MPAFQKIVSVLTLLLLASLFNATADEHLTPGSTSLDPTAFSGFSHSTIVGEVRPRWSGVAGQVFFVQEPAPGFPATAPVAVQTTLSVYATFGHHFRLLGNYNTAADGTFAIQLPPGNYLIEPAIGAPDTGLGAVQVTVVPRQVSWAELDLVALYDSNPTGVFPGN